MPAKRSGDDRSAEASGAGGAERWLILTVPVPPRGEELLLVDALHRLGARAVEREGARFAARLLPPRSVPALLEEARLMVRASTSMADPALEWHWDEHDRWAERWRHDHGPRRVTERIIVAAAGTEAIAREGDVLILLDPSTAFGTAEHATTRACLSFLERSVRPGDRVADVGAGSGILAIAAARLGAGRVLAVEAEPHAVAAARSNIALNGVGDRVTVRQLVVRAAAARRLGRHDVLVANLEARIICPLIPALQAAVVPGGWLVVSGILSPERDRVVAAAVADGWALRDAVEEDGWWTGCFLRQAVTSSSS